MENNNDELMAAISFLEDEASLYVDLNTKDSEILKLAAATHKHYLVAIQALRDKQRRKANKEAFCPMCGFKMTLSRRLVDEELE